VLDSGGGEIWVVLFSPDGRRLVTGDLDGAAHLWYVQEDDMIGQACAMAGRNLTWNEWQQFMGDTPYRKTCTDLPIHPGLIDAASNYVQSGNIAAASDISTRVIELNAATEIPRLSWNKLCWHGSLAGFAAEVLHACEQAVSLAPDNGDYRDSRGLARALTGDNEGAIEDFTFAIEKMRSGANDQAYVEKRTAWIAALKAGQNPFDEATLEQLQEEEITTEP
jgi:tetratricopeptide (TPR) repeat protein